MRIFKKIREEFKGQNLLTKISTILVSLLLAIVLFWVGFFMIHFAWNWGEKMVHRHSVSMTQPISSTYSLQTYKDGSLQLIVTETRKKVGPRFTAIHEDDILTDSVAFIRDKKGWRTFSLKTGAFSEEYFDNIEHPDTLHHYAACSREGLLGFLDIHSGKLAIPLKFCAPNNYRPETPLDDDYPHPILLHEEHCLDMEEELAEICEAPAVRDGKPVTEPEDYYPEYEYPSFRKKESQENNIQFVGNYCIVPTTTSTYGVIDVSGRILFDGYESITHYADCKLFKARKNDKYDLFAENGQCLLAQQKRIPVLPQGVIHPPKGILTNHTCTETLTNLVMRNYVSQLDEYGYKDYYLTYKENDYTVSSVTDCNSPDYCWYRDNTKYGIKETRTGRTVIEPVWEDVDIYTDGRDSYIFKCKEGRYSFLLDENGKFLSRRTPR